MINQLQSIDTNLLSSILEKFSEEQKIIALLTTLSDIELEHLIIAHKHKRYKEEIINLKQLLLLEESDILIQEISNHPELGKYIAGQPEKIFQNRIEHNLWVFGVDYKSHKNEARKIALFSEADLIMESLDGFMDLIELKRPKFDVIQLDPSHNSYYPSKDLAKVLGQSGFYLKKMDEYKMQLQNEHKIKVLRPRVKIIIGRSHNFNDDQFEAMRMLNSSLNHIQIISYDYLLSCGEKIISQYEYVSE